MKTHATLVCAWVVLLGSVSSVSAGMINIDLNGQWAGDTAVTYSGAAAIGAAGDVWNGYLVDCNGQTSTTPPQSGLLEYADGTTSTAKFQLSAVGGVYGDQDIASANNLVNDFAFTGQGWPSITFTLEGLASNGLYDVYLYGARYYDYYQTNFTIGSSTLTCSGSPFDGTFTETRDYVKFSGVQASDTGVITGTAGAVAVPNVSYAPFVGLQVSEVPEPNTLALLVSALAGLLAYAWRKRR